MLQAIVSYFVALAFISSGSYLLALGGSISQSILAICVGALFALLGLYHQSRHKKIKAMEKQILPFFTYALYLKLDDKTWADVKKMAFFAKLEDRGLLKLPWKAYQAQGTLPREVQVFFALPIQHSKESIEKMIEAEVSADKRLIAQEVFLEVKDMDPMTAKNYLLSRGQNE